MGRGGGGEDGKEKEGLFQGNAVEEEDREQTRMTRVPEFGSHLPVPTLSPGDHRASLRYMGVAWC